MRYLGLTKNEQGQFMAPTGLNPFGDEMIGNANAASGGPLNQAPDQLAQYQHRFYTDTSGRKFELKLAPNATTANNYLNYLQQIEGPDIENGYDKTPSELLGTYRDLQGDPGRMATTGQSYYDVVKHTPVYNPSMGPQINMGQGNVPLTNIQQNPTPGAGFTAQAGGQQVNVPGTQGGFTMNSNVVPQRNPGQSQNQIQSYNQPAQAQQYTQSTDQPQNQSTSSNPLASLTRNLAPGVSGDDVKQLQNYLISQGYDIPAGATGYYGPQTATAVSAWQQANGITNDPSELGFFGPKSMAFLNQGQSSNPQTNQATQGQETSQGGFQVSESSNPTSVALSSAGIQNITNETPDSIIQKISASLGITGYTDQLNDLDKKMTDEIANVNDNPWVSESLRTRKIANIQEKYQTRRQGLIDTIRLQQDSVGRALDVYYKEKSLQSSMLSQTLDTRNKQLALVSDHLGVLINTGAIADPASANAIKQEFANLGGFTGYTPQMIDSISQASRNQLSLDQLRASKSGVTVNVGNGNTGGLGTDPQGDAWAKLVDQGRVEIGGVPREFQGYVASRLASQPTKQESEIVDNISLVDSILNDPVLPNISGIPDLRTKIPGSSEQHLLSLFDQLKAVLSINNRQKLKGGGQISDYEAKLLSDASTALTRSLSDADFVKELKKIRGAFSTASGLKTEVRVIPKNGIPKTGYLGRSEIESAVKQGYRIEYL